jgi:hypothetical protein
MLRKSIFKRVIITVLSGILIIGGTLSIDRQEAKAVIINGGDFNDNIKGMVWYPGYALVRVNTTLDARYEPNGRLIGSVYNNDVVKCYANYTDSHGVYWELIEYPVTGTGNTKMGWVHSQYLIFC